MKIEIRTLGTDFHEVTVTTDNTVTIETHYNTDLIALKEELEGALEYIECTFRGD